MSGDPDSRFVGVTSGLESVTAFTRSWRASVSAASHHPGRCRALASAPRDRLEVRHAGRPAWLPAARAAKNPERSTPTIGQGGRPGRGADPPRLIRSSQARATRHPRGTGLRGLRRTYATRLIRRPPSTTRTGSHPALRRQTIRPFEHQNHRGLPRAPGAAPWAGDREPAGDAARMPAQPAETHGREAGTEE